MRKLFAIILMVGSLNLVLPFLGCKERTTVDCWNVTGAKSVASISEQQKQGMMWSVAKGGLSLGLEPQKQVALQNEGINLLLGFKNKSTEELVYTVPPSFTDEGAFRILATGPKGRVVYKGERYTYTLMATVLPVNGEDFYSLRLDPKLWSITEKGTYTLTLCYEHPKKPRGDVRNIWDGIVETPECTFIIR